MVKQIWPMSCFAFLLGTFGITICVYLIFTGDVHCITGFSPSGSDFFMQSYEQYLWSFTPYPRPPPPPPPKKILSLLVNILTFFYDTIYKLLHAYCLFIFKLKLKSSSTLSTILIITFAKYYYSANLLYIDSLPVKCNYHDYIIYWSILGFKFY